MRSGAIIYPLLAAYGELTDLVSTANMYAVRAEQGASIASDRGEYIVYREISSVPLNTTGDTVDNAADPRIQQRSILDTNRVQISVFASDYYNLENIAVKVREALDREWGSVNTPYENDIYVDSIVFEGAVDDYDDDSGNRGIYVKHLDFVIRVLRYKIENTWTNNYSLAFDGVDDYVTFGDNALWSINGSDAGRGWSYSVWINVPGEHSTQWITSKSGAFDLGSYHYEWELLVRYNGQVRFILYFNDTNTDYITMDVTDILSVDTWYHIVITYDLTLAKTGFRMYVNNIRKTDGDGATVTLTGSWGTASNTMNPMYLARNSGVDYAAMYIDEVSIWDKVLSAAHIEDLYNSGKTGDPNRYPVASDYLAGYWRCGDGATYPTIPDAAPLYSNPGTMTNMAADDINTEVP